MVQHDLSLKANYSMPNFLLICFSIFFHRLLVINAYFSTNALTSFQTYYNNKLYNCRYQYHQELFNPSLWMFHPVRRESVTCTLRYHNILKGRTGIANYSSIWNDKKKSIKTIYLSNQETIKSVSYQQKRFMEYQLKRKRAMDSSSTTSTRLYSCSQSTEKDNIESNRKEENIENEQFKKLQNDPLVIIIAGCTGVGKSDVAFQLCQPKKAHDILSSHCNNINISTSFLDEDKEPTNLMSSGQIISADSVQAYQGVTIGANKPSQMELEQITHHLVDIVPPTGQYSAAEWREDALKVLKRITRTEKDTKKDILQKEDKQNHSKVLPIVVGGTMMYLQWLVHGKPDALKPTKEAMEKASQFVEKYQSMSMEQMKTLNEEDDDEIITDKGWLTAMEETSKLGPIFKARVDKLPGKDWYRLRRTLEVAFTVLDKINFNSNIDININSSSQTQEEIEIEIEIQKQQQKLLENTFTGRRIDALCDLGYDVRCFFLCPSDRMLHTTLVDERCEQMLLRGLIKETTDLSLNGDLPLDGQPAKAIGYRQVLEYLNRSNFKPGDADSFSQFLDGFTAATRQYSKKQMSWFRKDKKFMFIPVPLLDGEKKDDSNTMITKQKRVDDVVHKITQMCTLSKERYQAELMSVDPRHFSVMARKMNEDQAKGMKVYQGKRYYLLEGSDALKQVMEEADDCTRRIQNIT